MIHKSQLNCNLITIRRCNKQFGYSLTLFRYQIDFNLLGMQTQTFRVLSLTSPYFTLFTFIYFISAKQVHLTTIQYISFSFFVAQTLFIVPFLLSFIVKFKLHHYDILRIINTYLNFYFIIVVFLSSVILSISSYAIIFYEFYVKQRSEGGMWSIQISIFLSLITYILYSKTLMLAIENKILTYVIFIVLMLLVILFLAHFSIMTSQTIYQPQLCLEIIIVVILLDCWWTKTPAAILIIIIGTDIVSIEEFLRKIVLQQEEIALLVYRIIILAIIFIHFIIRSIELIRQVRKCINQFYEEDNKDVPLSSIMISQIPMVEFQNKNPLRVGKDQFIKQVSQCSINSISSEIEGICAICTMKIEPRTLILQIPCLHSFHSECLGRWLQLRNSCPTCRKPVV